MAIFHCYVTSPEGILDLYPTHPIFSPFFSAGAPSNATALALLGHLERLHGTLRLAARKQKEQLVERQLQQSVRQLQRQAQLQLRSLGVYRLETWMISDDDGGGKRAWDQLSRCISMVCPKKHSCSGEISFLVILVRGK